MNGFFRNLKKAARRLFNAKTITLDGIKISTQAGTISKQVRNGLFKENYEEPERILIRDALARGDRVLEIGGGIGFISLLCSKICGPENVLTYEANPAMAATIQRNYALNGMTPQLRSKAITARGHEATFFVSDNIISSSLHERKDGRPKTVPADPFDEVIAEWKPTAVVMDVEGAETTLLPSSKLDGVSKIVLELHPHIVGDPGIATLKKYLQEIGFREGRSVRKSSLFTRPLAR